MWFNYFPKIELKYKYQLSKKRHIVIQMDGKNIVKSQRFNLIDKNEFTNALLSATEAVVKNFHHCTAYVIMDEVSFIFKDASEFFNSYSEHSDSLQYCLSIFQQHFLREFWKILPNIFFGVSIFNVPELKTNNYLKYRKVLGYNTAIVYFAKRHLKKQEYINQKQKTIKETILKNGLQEELTKYPHFTQGTMIDFEYIVNKENIYDNMIFKLN